MNNDPHHDLLHHHDSPVIGGIEYTEIETWVLSFKPKRPVWSATYFIGKGAMLCPTSENCKRFSCEDDALSYQDKLVYSTEDAELEDFYMSFEAIKI